MRLLTPNEIDTIATEAAQANLTPSVARRVFSESTIDSQGQDALLLTVVVSPSAAESISGEALIKNLIDTQNRLREAGEDRRAIFSYATEEDLASAGDQS